MDIKDRISEYCKHKNIAISRFEKSAGLSNGYFNQVKKRPSEDKIRGILEAFPDLNTDWLLTGEGSMLKSNVTQTSHGDNSPNINGNGNSVTVGETAVLKERIKALEAVLAEKERLIRLYERVLKQTEE